MNKIIFKNPLVIGYKGEIGSFILKGLLRVMPKALNILCYDLFETKAEKINRIKKSDIIFLCVPLENTVDWFAKYGKYLEGKTVIEQCSVKGILFESRRFAICYYKLLSMHILYRPSITPNLSDRKVLLINRESWSKDLVKFVENITQSEICWLEDYKEHDERMAYEQALIHRVILTLGKLSNRHTYIGKRIGELADRIKSGNPGLYSLIQSNKYLPYALQDFDTEFSKFNIKKEFK